MSILRRPSVAGPWSWPPIVALLYSFEFAAPDSGRVLTRLAEKPADEKPAIVPFLASRGAELWLAAYGVTRYDIQASRGALAPKWINDEQGVVLHAPLVAGSAIAYITRSAHSGATPRRSTVSVAIGFGNCAWASPWPRRQFSPANPIRRSRLPRPAGCMKCRQPGLPPAS